METIKLTKAQADVINKMRDETPMYKCYGLMDASKKWYTLGEYILNAGVFNSLYSKGLLKILPANIGENKSRTILTELGRTAVVEVTK